MREIKFRAWDKKKKEMIPWDELKADYDFYITVSSSRAIPMQYTGLKDKDGKEIYEGDIVRYDLGEREEEMEGERYCYGFVEYKNGAFWVNEKEEGDNWVEVPLIEQFEEYSSWEPIGNIYEKPELLDKLM